MKRNSPRTNLIYYLTIEEIIYNTLDELKSSLIIHKRCQVVIYNLDSSDTRTVEVDCSEGSGLGFEIATGVLHDLGIILRNKEAKLSKNKVQQILSDYAEKENESIFEKTQPNENLQEKSTEGRPKIYEGKSETSEKTVEEKKDEPVEQNNFEQNGSLDLDEEIQIEMT